MSDIAQRSQMVDSMLYKRGTEDWAGRRMMWWKKENLKGGIGLTEWEIERVLGVRPPSQARSIVQGSLRADVDGAIQRPGSDREKACLLRNPMGGKHTCKASKSIAAQAP